MKITIAERLKPFSHQPGTRLVLPGTTLIVQAFPTLIRVGGHEIPLELTGPVKQFTVQLDLEKGCIWIWGFYREGYHRFRLWSDHGKFRFAEARGSRKSQLPSLSSPAFERLSLGVHKKQDWCLIKRRCDLKEIAPHWLRLAQFIPEVLVHHEGTAGLLEQIPNDRQTLYTDFLTLFNVGFEGIFNPLLENQQYLGVEIPKVSGTPSPLALIAQGAKRLRKALIEHGSFISILPCLPVQFHSGRFVSLNLGLLGSLDIEWCKKLIKRMIFRCRADQEIPLYFQQQVKSFRLRTSRIDKGKIYSVNELIQFRSNQNYFFDRFQK